MARKARPRTGDQALVREINLSLIMNHLRQYAPVSRAMLAEMTGLNKTTVSSLINELMEHDFVHEVGFDNSGLGRPAVLLELDPAAGCILSCEIGVDFITVVLTDFAANIIWRHHELTQGTLGQREILDRTLALLREALDSNTNGCNQLLGLAVGVPGLVDQHTGTLLFAPNLNWRNVPLADMLREAFDAPVYVDNEANLAALGEAYFGAAQGCDEVLYISVGVGLGGGIVRSGSLMRGVGGYAGEFGHMTVVPDGYRCNCGNRGCWETVVSQAAIFRSIQQAVENGAATALADGVNGALPPLTIPQVVQAAVEGDAVSRRALEDAAHYLGIGIASLVNALDPELVVFGGILSEAADVVLPIVISEVNDRSLDPMSARSSIVLARHGANACVMGGVATVYQNVLSQPIAAVRQKS